MSNSVDSKIYAKHEKRKEASYEFLCYSHIANLPLQDGSRETFMKLWNKINEFHDKEIDKARKEGAKQELESLLKDIEAKTVPEMGIWKARKMIQERLLE